MASIAVQRTDKWVRSREQRMEALQQANEVRTARAHVKVQLRSGELHISDVLIAPPECAKSARVAQLLLAVPGMGEVKVGRVMRAYNISPGRSVAGLSRRQRAALAEHFRA